MPEISVLIPYYNDKDFLNKAIESVLSQTFNDFELILLNHATTDNCREIAHSYKDPRIRHIDLERNNGAGGGIIFEEFIKNSTGNFIKPFCADDEMEKNCLEKLYNHFIKHPKCDVVFGDAEFIDSDSQLMNVKWSDNFKDFNLYDKNSDLLKKYFEPKSFLPYPASMFRRRTAELIDTDKSFIIEFDQSLWIQMLLKQQDFGFIKDCVIKYRIHENQESSRSKRESIRKYDFYESIFRAKLFFKVENLSSLKIMTDDFYMIDKLTEKDKEFFPFVIACYYIEKHSNRSCQIAGYEYIHDILQNSAIREKLRNKFEFGIAEFRAMYKNIEVDEPGIKGLLKILVKKIYKKLLQDFSLKYEKF